METYGIRKLRAMAKDQNIKYICAKRKEELCKLMNIPFNGIKDSYKHLNTIRDNPKRICLTNDETNQVYNFNSISLCCKYFKINSGYFGNKRKAKNRADWIIIGGIKYKISYP